MQDKKNKIIKFLQLKGAKQKDLFEYLKSKGVPKVSRQHVSVYCKGDYNPRKDSIIRQEICNFFGLEDKEIFYPYL